MGFTRYWNRLPELDATRFEAFAHDCEAICETCEALIINAIFDTENVAFTGDPGCEPFRIQRISPSRVRDGRVFEFCKTERLPYDEAVAQCLALLQKHFPAEVEVSPAN